VSDQLLTTSVENQGDDVVVTVTGELDFGTAPGFLDTTQPLLAAGRTVTLDLTDLTFCDSSGLGALVRLHKRAAESGGEVVLSHVRDQILSTIQLTMLHRVLTVRED
jgi:anti-sigma B factor antagonist